MAVTLQIVWIPVGRSGDIKIHYKYKRQLLETEIPEMFAQKFYGSLLYAAGEYSPYKWLMGLSHKVEIIYGIWNYTVLSLLCSGSTWVCTVGIVNKMDYAHWSIIRRSVIKCSRKTKYVYVQFVM